MLRALLAGLLCSAAVGAADLEPLLDRPITLPRGRVDLTLHGTYTNWTNSSVAGSGSLDGETLALGLDFGATDRVQLGLALALPIHPGAAFGSVLGNAQFAGDPRYALRLDFGYENVGFNGDTGGFLSGHVGRYFGGIGAAIKVPIAPTVAFVTGRSGAVQFGHFNNLGESGTGFYEGASTFTEASSDFLVISGGGSGSSTIVGFNLPAGLLVQADPHLAITLQAGYSVFIESSVASHFIPLAVEAVVTPAPVLDIGVRFFVDGFVGQTGASGAGPGFNYFDLRALMLWLRVRV